MQNAHSLLNRTFEGSLAEVCYREKVGLLAYSALAFGHLTGKYSGRPQGGGPRITLWHEFGQRFTPKVNVAPAVAAHAAPSLPPRADAPTQLALAFVRWFVAGTIPGASSLAQLQGVEPAAAAISPERAEILREIGTPSTCRLRHQPSAPDDSSVSPGLRPPPRPKPTPCVAS